MPRDRPGRPGPVHALDDGRVKMCDFGFACLSDATKITATGAWAGTPLYMAPEQIRGEPVDNRTVAFSPDGKTLAMGDADGDDPTSSLPLWELP